MSRTNLATRSIWIMYWNYKSDESHNPYIRSSTLHLWYWNIKTEKEAWFCSCFAVARKLTLAPTQVSHLVWNGFLHVEIITHLTNLSWNYLPIIVHHLIGKTSQKSNIFIIYRYRVKPRLSNIRGCRTNQLNFVLSLIPVLLRAFSGWHCVRSCVYFSVVTKFHGIKVTMTA
jgi:hypothetical protein